MCFVTHCVPIANLLVFVLFIVYQWNSLANDGTPVFLLQQRAPCIRGKVASFCKEISELLFAQWNCGLLAIVTGASTENVDDGALQGYVGF